MAHWAELDESNVVICVTVGSNGDPDEGHGWLVANLGGRWVQTSYNGNFRKQFAGIGYTYDEEADVFVAPQPFPSWTLDENHDWQPPVPIPRTLPPNKAKDGDGWRWDEGSLSWITVSRVEVAAPTE
jgi:hypothetical protein